MAALTMLAPLAAVRSRTRLMKMIPVLRRRGCAVHFLGWERVVGEFERWQSPDLEETVIMRGGGYSSAYTRCFYPLWMITVFLRVLRLGRVRLFCLGWETAFPAVLASFFTGSKILFDDADRFSLVVGLPRPFNRILTWLEEWTSRRVAVHVIPSFSRYEWRHPNMIVLRNTPSLADYEVVSQGRDIAKDSDLVVYVNGWIGETRGAPTFLKAISLLSDAGANIKMVVAGRVEGVSALELIRHPLVDYKGELPQADALAIYKVADIALTYYDPQIPINRMAESNKWGDCIFLGVPFVVNREVVTAEPFVNAGAAFSIPYDDEGALADLLLYLNDNKVVLQRARRAMDNFLEEFSPFDQRLEVVFDHFWKAGYIAESRASVSGK